MNKRMVFLCAAVFALAAATAQAESTIQLFDGETLFGWTKIGDGNWNVADKAIVCDGGSGGWLATTSQFADFELAAKVRLTSEEDEMAAGLVVRAGLEGHPAENGSTVIPLEQKGKGDWMDIAVKAEGATVTATVQGKEAKITVGARKRGYIGILFYRNGKVEVSQMSLKPTGFKPIFNGKDLSGWNIIPKRKSEFSVIDGALNIKNGNGQIETAGVYRDFVLQLDIFSNGEHLNSGVFYRGPVGVFWKGYESQVRNQWEGEDRTKPVDFGTGGNYGNQAARKVVSSDKQWFTKTVVCEGNHTAVWIDGYLVSDYIDMRPVSEDSNGKEGYVPGPGTIHLQGHDPTTDLSFKNINVAEFPEK